MSEWDGIVVLQAILTIGLGLMVNHPAMAQGLESLPVVAGSVNSAVVEDGWDAQHHERGRKIYNFRCYFCHGYSGDARTLASSYLSPKPRNFLATSPGELSRERMVTVITSGISGSAMAGFGTILGKDEIAEVADFVRWEFMIRHASNTRYHTKANGWDNHERYAVAFPFATGALALDTPDDQLTVEQRQGKQLFFSACITCHDRGRVEKEGPIWDSRPVSFPRNGVTPETVGKIDGVSGASIYAVHDRPAVVADLTPVERLGETLFQKNCAFCHAADGTGKNWIGRFLEPHPRDLTTKTFMDGQTATTLLATLREGIPGTSMPAWKSVLSDEKLIAILHYIHRVFHPVAGLQNAMTGKAPPSP
ncbi:MAG: cytochrome c [Nitrospirae bacterium]|nr:cytochrome c [Magnetococcales bacterium]